MSSPAAASSDVLHISTKFDDSVHEYQFARSHPQLFAQLQQLTAAKYPLTPLYIHYSDDDGDMVRVTNEAELREAVRVCGSRLNLVLSSGLPSSAFSSAPQQLSLIASPTLVSHTPSPSPSLTSSSPLNPPSHFAAAVSGESIDDIDDYLSSDEEELFEQARSQARSQHSQQSIAEAGSEVESEAEEKSPRYGVVALDSEDEDDEQARIEPSTTEQPGAHQSQAAVPRITEVVAGEQEPAPAVQSAAEPIAEPAASVSDTAEELDDLLLALQAQKDFASAVQSPSTPPQSAQPHVDSIQQPAASSESKVEEKDEIEDGVEAINARLRSFYQLDQQRQAIVSSVSTDSSPIVPPVRSPLPVPIAALFTSFFAEPDVIATIRDNAALLTPLMTSSSLPLFLHHLCLLNPTLSSQPLTRYTFALSSLHPFTVCVHCSVSPVVGRLLYCRQCDVTLCGTCQQQGQHPTDHPLAELALPEYRREASIAVSPSASSGVYVANAARVDDGGRVLEERKASDFTELSDRMRASGQKVWKQGAVSLRKVDEMLSAFAADIKRMIESMLDGVFNDAPSNNNNNKPSQHQQSVDEQKQMHMPVASPRSRQQQPSAGGCNVRRPPCLPTSSPNTAPSADAREAGVPLAQPVRQHMSYAEVARVDDRSRPSQPQQPPQPPQQPVAVSGGSGVFQYRAQLDTCKELLTASKGNVEQAVQWLMDKINV